MVAIVTLIVTLTIAMLVTRIGAAALKLTGISEDIARFQARSAFTGVGFTTSEAEKVVNHPVRRRIIGILMLAGNVGIAAVIASMMATFANDPSSQAFLVRLGFLLAFVLALWVVGTQKWVDATISRTIEWALLKWTKFDSADYVALLRLSSGFVVVELEVEDDDWVAGRTLAESSLTLEGVLVLGVNRKNEGYVGSPNGRTMVQAGDMITVYGPIDRLKELNLRKFGAAGDAAHRKSVKDQKAVVELQQEESPAEAESAESAES